MNSAFAVVFLVLVAGGAAADPWRTFAGGVGSRWNTLGHHGHDQPPCDPRVRELGGIRMESRSCDAIDFERANLDDSIGFRAGKERDLWQLGPVRIVAGGDVAVAHTEYNLSQRDFALVTAAIFGGADLELAGVRLGLRHGRGAYSVLDTERRGLLRFNELNATLPLRGGVGVRFSRRVSAINGMAQSAPLRESALSLVAAGARSRPSQWEFVAATGLTMPGAGLGGDRKLRPTALNRTAALRTFSRRDLQLELSWTSTAHESSVESAFRGYSGNFRSKTIEGYAIALGRTIPLTRRLSMRWRAGVELADWRDEHRLLTRNGAELVAGVEVAAAVGVAVRTQLRPGLAIETAADKVYWHAIDLSEVRCTTGIVLTP